jgi:hypothetical protein
VTDFVTEAANRSMDRMLRSGHLENGVPTFEFRLEDTEAVLLEMEHDPRQPCGVCGRDPCEGTALSEPVR